MARVDHHDDVALGVRFIYWSHQRRRLRSNLARRVGGVGQVEYQAMALTILWRQ